MKRIVLLNAFPLNAFPFERFAATFERVGLQQLAADVERANEVANFIRHPATVAALSRVLPRELRPESGFYAYQPNDVVYIITLRQLPQRGVEVTTVKPEELDIVRVEVTTR
jgi:hypothetical protein